MVRVYKRSFEFFSLAMNDFFTWISDSLLTLAACCASVRTSSTTPDSDEVPPSVVRDDAPASPCPSSISVKVDCDCCPDLELPASHPQAIDTQPLVYFDCRV